MYFKRFLYSSNISFDVREYEYYKIRRPMSKMRGINHLHMHTAKYTHDCKLALNGIQQLEYLSYLQTNHHVTFSITPKINKLISWRCFHSRCALDFAGFQCLSSLPLRSTDVHSKALEIEIKIKVKSTQFPIVAHINYFKGKEIKNILCNKINCHLR